ncbi:nitrogen assimilation transcription factor nirA [Colletotrichum tofieldiae]|nr:nitrogen assimilation transcription factor nirA [Colletotrichum tofieldiae]
MHLAIGASSRPSQRGFGAPAEASASTPAQTSMPSRVTKAITQSIRDLEEMVPCHPFAVRALEIVRYFANEWRMDVNICNGPTLDAEHALVVRPYARGVHFFAPKVMEDDFGCAWDGSIREADVQNLATTIVTEGVETEKPSGSRADGGTENPLFWPFLMNGRPMQPAGGDLEEAGFERI